MTDTQPMSEVGSALAVKLDSTLLTFIRTSQGKSLDERVALLDGFTYETVFGWIQQVNAVNVTSGAVLYDMVYYLYRHVPDDKWTEALRDLSKATGRPYESFRKNFNKWLTRNEKELTEEHAERRERALAAVEEAGSNGSPDAEDDDDAWEFDVDELTFLRENDEEVPLDGPADEEAEEVDLSAVQDERRTPLTVATEEVARLKAEWIANKAESLGDSEFSERAATAAAEKLTSTVDGDGVSLDEWKVGLVKSYGQSGYDEETSSMKADVDWWKRQLKIHGYAEEVLKPEVVEKPKKAKNAPTKPKTKQAKLERAMEMVREVFAELGEQGVVAEDRQMLGVIQSMTHSLKGLEARIKGSEPVKPAKSEPVTSKSAPADWKPPAI